MEGERRTRQGRKPLSDRTNLPLNITPSRSSSSHPKLPPPPLSPPPPPPPPITITISTAAAAAAGYLVEPDSSNKKKKKILIDTGETLKKKKKRRKFADPTLGSIHTNEGNKENVDTNIITSPASPSTPSVRQPLSLPDEQLTVYARRRKQKVVLSEAFSCPPVERKRGESSKVSILKDSKCRTDRPRKRRIKEHDVSKDYIEQQKAYFAEIDRCELPEEEVSESELSDHGRFLM